jgi:long-chain acyl-CoA synthetase
MEDLRVAQPTARTIPRLFRQRAAENPDTDAYREYDAGRSTWKLWTWHDISRRVDEYASAIACLDLQRGDRVAILLSNGPDWVAFDVAAMSCGLVTVPLYLHDSPRNWAAILSNTECRLLLLDTPARWAVLERARPEGGAPLTVWVRQASDAHARPASSTPAGATIVDLATALSLGRGCKPPPDPTQPDDLATIIYTSGTTATPKGVMLSHRALLWNAVAVTRFIAIRPDDVFLSILPLAHAFERTLGCILPMMAGSSVAFSRSPQTLAEDFKSVRPTVFLGVPRIYERIVARIRRKAGSRTLGRWLLETTARIGWAHREAATGRGPPPSLLQRLAWPLLEWFVAGRVLSALGGRLRVVVSGGAPLDPDIARFLAGLGLPLVEGYGLTEAAPVVTATTFEDSLPGSVGRPLHGVQVRLGADDELLVKTPSRMIGYWADAAATNEVLVDGWLRTGDIARIEENRIFITGRLKDLLVLSTGEKVPASAVEAAITADPLFAQACVVGDARPYLVAIVVADRDEWSKFAADRHFDPDAPNGEDARRHVLRRLQACTPHLSAPSQIRAAHIDLDAWTAADAMLTPTLKVRRDAVKRRYAHEIEALYATGQRAARKVSLP